MNFIIILIYFTLCWKMKYDDDDDDDDLSKILKVIDNTSQRSTTMSCF